MNDSVQAPAKGPAMRRPSEPTTLKASGKIAVFDEDYSADAVIAAQKAAGRKTELFPAYLISAVAILDGARVTAGAVRTLPGRDYLQLVGLVLGEDEDEKGEDGDDGAGE